MIRQVLVADIVEIVVIWILCHASVEIRPCQDILLAEVQ
jgi:hypothetical protein